MQRSDGIPVPSSFSGIASNRAMGGFVHAMSGGSRLQAWQNKQLVIVVYEQGSVVGLANDPAPFHFRYDEVSSFTQDVVKRYVNQSYRGISTTCWIGLNDGRSHRFQGQSTRTERNVVDDFRQLVDPRIAAAQFPGMLAMMRQGQAVAFGAYVLEPGALTTGTGRKHKRLPWAQVEQVTLERGLVKVTERGRRRAWATASTSAVPNLTAFFNLVREAQAGR
ncbi:DUF6585 family protein [Streptomyces sp. ME19-01-6]|uniref:DUF6585 family protein n=1 Tax=Streptomyces sp. ME19-01-6 TaxID=3028686 RepID=UPI0029BF9556|nr:DUF6585 family protein [Streptomyces sp. ME19-01-6]MDX3233641.1 hypothetical protein [Streptomyces sp. ME19-01-6]